MPSLVFKLQQSAMDETINVSSLLRETLFVASKLEIREFEDWAKLELEGYSKQDTVPDYRTLQGQLKRVAPGGRVELIDFSSLLPILGKTFSIYEVRDSINQIEDLLKREGDIDVKHHRLTDIFGLEAGITIMIELPRPNLLNILHTVRNIILKWSLKLERDGIGGQERGFSNEEKQRASSQIYNIENYIHVHQMTDSQIQQDTRESTQEIALTSDILDALQEFTKELKLQLSESGLKPVAIQEAKVEAERLEIQITSEHPKLSIIKQSLLSLKNILEEAAGNVIASTLLQQVPFLIAKLGSP